MGRTPLIAVLGAALAVGALPGAATAAPASGTVEWAPAAAARVHPGVVTRTGEVSCTSNFLFTDATGALYLGQAALCAHRHARPADGPDGLRRGGCTFVSYPLGTAVEVVGTGVVGTLAYSSWVTMQRVGEKVRSTCKDNNFALVRLPDDARRFANPSVPVLGGPTGLPSRYTPVGATVVGYAAGPAHLGVPLLGPMPGQVIGHTDDGWAHLVYSVPPGLPGDSGSGYLDGRGCAVGSLANLTVDPPVANTVTDLAMALQYARDRGGVRGLRLIAGTEPFTGFPPQFRPIPR